MMNSTVLGPDVGIGRQGVQDLLGVPLAELCGRRRVLVVPVGRMIHDTWGSVPAATSAAEVVGADWSSSDPR